MSLFGCRLQILEQAKRFHLLPPSVEPPRCRPPFTVVSLRTFEQSVTSLRLLEKRAGPRRPTTEGPKETYVLMLEQSSLDNTLTGKTHGPT